MVPLLEMLEAGQTVPVVDLAGTPLTPCTPQKALQNLDDGLAEFHDGVLRLNYRPLAYRRIYRQVRRRDRLVCAWCHDPGSSLEHVLPICRGGRTELENCVIACRACNHSRDNLLPSEFLERTRLEPTHPVILAILADEAGALLAAEESLRQRPIQTCVSKEEAQVWVAFRQNGYLNPPPPKLGRTRVHPEPHPFFECYVP